MKKIYIHKNIRRLLAWTVAVFIMALSSGCATVPKPRPGVYKKDHLKSICERHRIEWQWDSVSQVMILRKHNRKARVLIGSAVALVDDNKVVLSSPVKRVRSAIIIPPDFVGKVIDPLKAAAGFVIRRFKRVVIDAGHGGKDPGAIGRTGLQEKTVVIDIAKRLQRILKKKGIKVTMTRTSDVFIPLNERTEIASRANADLFISIHANAWTRRSPQGFEVYYARGIEDKNNLEEQLDINKNMYFKDLSMKRQSRLEDILFDMLYMHKQAESASLACHVTNDASKKMGARNRGSHESGFFVLRNSLIPAILIEVGFISNAKEEKLLATNSYRQKLAEVIAESILKYK